MSEKIQEIDFKRLSECIVRLVNSPESSSDFADYVAAIKYYRDQATLQGLTRIGEDGAKARGMALAYIEMISQIEESLNPPEKIEQPPSVQ